MVTISNKSAVQTDVKAILQRLADFHATRACLTGAARIDFHQHTPSILSFVREFEDEVRPPSIVNTLSESRSRQSFDIQIFDGDQSVLVDQSPRQLMVEVRALRSDVSVNSLKQPHGLSPSVRTFLASGNPSLSYAQSPFTLPIVTRVLHRLPRRKRGERGESHINPNRVRVGWQPDCLNLASKDRKPASGFSLDSQSLNLAFERSVKFDFHTTNLRDTQLVPVECVSDSSERQAVVSTGRLKPRVSGLLDFN